MVASTLGSLDLAGHGPSSALTPPSVVHQQRPDCRYFSCWACFTGTAFRTLRWGVQLTAREPGPQSRRADACQPAFRDGRSVQTGALGLGWPSKASLGPFGETSTGPHLVHPLASSECSPRKEYRLAAMSRGFVGSRLCGVAQGKKSGVVTPGNAP